MYLCILLLFGVFGRSLGILNLPNTSGIDGQLTDQLNVDHFFQLWLVFNNEEVKMSDEPFTILAPKNSAGKNDENVLTQPDLVKQILLDHVVLGSQIDITNITSFNTLGGRTVKVHQENGELYANDAKILMPKVEVPNGVVIVLDNYLFPEEQILRKNGSYSEAEPGLLSVVTVTDDVKMANASFVENIMQVLSFLKSSVRVFQHFLARSNVSQLLKEGEEYTVFVPTDHAFQRWHPIDWGFYPFSVPEFTENVMINHFVIGNLRQDSLRDGQIAKTLGGREVKFHKKPSLSVNGALIVNGDTPVTGGNIMFISEVLFVSESVVSRLHQQNRDKETPPLLAFPWFGAQFLSHAFLALERDRRFSHITRFLNLADLAPYVSGTGYTFFVPMDTAFEKMGLDKMADNYLSTDEGLKILLNHFVKGRLYDRDLKNGTHLDTLGGKSLNVTRLNGTVLINDATIIETEVFVYNLGTMYYIDKILFVTADNLPAAVPTKPSDKTTTELNETNLETETIPSELIDDQNENMPDVLFADAEAPTMIISTVSNSNSTIK